MTLIQQLAVGLLLATALLAVSNAEFPLMSDERVIFTTDHGEIEFGFYPEVAPVTSQHIFTLARTGCYVGNHFFRVDKGFVAQTADVMSGRNIPLNAEQRAEALKTVPLEVHKDVKHHEGVLSMGRYDDPNSGTSSYSILLGDAQHLDMQYTIFAKVTRGMETLHKMEGLPTKREGIFVMPLQRIGIVATYWYKINKPQPQLTLPGKGACDDELEELKMRFESQADELQRVRKKCLPGA